jgi:maltose O-acetyltransferase
VAQPGTQMAAMLAGEPYASNDPELIAASLKAQELLARFNASDPGAWAGQRELLTELFAELGPGACVRPGLRCDYGFNIYLGSRSFLNFNCVLLDCNRIVIGSEVLLGPGVHIYTATHPVDPVQRCSGVEYARPVHIGNRAWLGGGVIVCPGVNIGECTVVGAGSVVVQDLPANVVAAGNPCKFIRSVQSE